jgi:hypothetical protein
MSLRHSKILNGLAERNVNEWLENKLASFADGNSNRFAIARIA